MAKDLFGNHQMFVHGAAVVSGSAPLAGERFSSAAQVPRQTTSLPWLRYALSTSIKSCQVSGLQAALLKAGARVSLAVGSLQDALSHSLTPEVATKEPSNDISNPCLGHEAPSRTSKSLPATAQPSLFCGLYFKQSMEKVCTSPEDLWALFPPCISSPVCVDLAPALHWVRWACSDRQTWAENGPGCRSGRRSRSAAFQRKRKSAASSLGTGRVPASCPWKNAHQTGPLKDECWLGVTNTGGTPRCGAGRFLHADGTPNLIR